MKASAACIIALMLHFPFGLPAQEGVVRFVYTEYVPANYKNQAGEHSGFFVDIIREVFEKRLGLQLSMETLPWKRCQAMVEAGAADLMATIPTPERLAYSVLVREPIWVKTYRIYTYRDHPQAERMNGIRNVQELAKERFVVLSYIGNSWSDTVLVEACGIRVVNASSVEGMYRMLQAKRADLIAEDPLLAGPAIRRFGLTRNLILTDGVVEESRFHLLVSVKSPFAPWANRFSETIEAMRADGTMDRIMARYR